MNVHFDCRSAGNRRLSAALLRDRIDPVTAKGTPVLFVGGINADSRSPTAERMAKAGMVFPSVEGSSHHFHLGGSLFFSAGRIGATQNLTRAGGPVVLPKRFGGEWPSDHHAVFADQILPR